MFCRCGAVLVGVLTGLTAAAPVVNLQAAASAVPSAFAAAQQNSTTGVGNSATAATAPRNYGAVIAFGASYEDNGHSRPSQYASSLTGYPYVGGRRCNGPVTVESLYSDLGASTFYDYAYSGAMIDNSHMYGNVPDTKTQISQYTSDTKSLSYATGRRLYVFWAGANNVLAVYSGVKDNLDTNGGISQINSVIGDVASQIQSLQAISDGSVHDLLILPIPPLETAPIITYSSNSKQIALMAQLVSTYNNGIASIVSSAAQRAAGTNTKVFTYDVPSFFKNAMSSPRSYGLYNTGDPCVGNGVCSNPSSYLWWDTLHITTTFAAALAKSIAAVITSSS